jgi:hypothetical protein
MTTSFVDIIPTWIFFFGLLILFFLFVELGFYLGHRQKKHAADLTESRKLHGRLVFGGIFTLVAFLLAFTFSMAESQYSTRRNLILDHANSISSTYLRSESMPEPHRTNIENLLREYAKLRLNIDEENFADIMQRTEQIEQQIWSEAILITQKDSSPIVSIFLQSLNEMIDLHAKRLNIALWTRIPEMLILTLAFLTAILMVLYGYMLGLTERRDIITRSVLILAFSTVFLMVIDLDRPQGGIFKISQQPMIELYKSMTK